MRIEDGKLIYKDKDSKDIRLNLPGTANDLAPINTDIGAIQAYSIDMNTNGNIIAKTKAGTPKLLNVPRITKVELTTSGKLKATHSFGGANDVELDIPTNTQINTINTDISALKTGFDGPYVVRFYAAGDTAHACLDSDQFSSGKGAANCTSNNTKQQWLYNNTTGQLKNVSSGKCMDYNKDAGIGLLPCNNHENQQFWKTGHSLRWKNEKCLDIDAGTTRSNICDSRKSQVFRFDNKLSRGTTTNDTTFD